MPSHTVIDLVIITVHVILIFIIISDKTYLQPMFPKCIWHDIVFIFTWESLNPGGGHWIPEGVIGS